MTYLWLGLGGALGTIARYLVSVSIARQVGIVSAGTFVANVSGALLIGFLAVIFNEHADLPPDLRRFVIIGLLGGYTTFSTLAYDTARYMETGELTQAVLNALGSLMVGVLAVFVGMAMARAL